MTSWLITECHSHVHVEARLKNPKKRRLKENLDMEKTFILIYHGFWCIWLTTNKNIILLSSSFSNPKVQVLVLQNTILA